MQIATLSSPGGEDTTRAVLDYIAPILDAILARHPTPHLAVAVSGGGDSMALLLLTKRWCDATGRRLTALTVDHQLRPESAGEARQVRAWCTARKIPHHILSPEPLADQHNLQARARDMRYTALTDWCARHDAPLLLVAHHADDQAETVALQKHRGDSPPSRSGMALVSMRGETALGRPLLGVRKAALRAYLLAAQQPWIEDPSNDSDAYARNRLRETLDETTTLSLWAEAQTQGKLRHEEDTTRNAWIAAHTQEDGDGIALDPKIWRALPDAARTDMLSRTIHAVGGKAFRPRFHETKRVDQQLRAPRGKVTLGHCLIVWKPGAWLRIQPEPSPLERGHNAPHITRANPLKQLASEPFWWFNYPPLPLA